MLNFYIISDEVPKPNPKDIEGLEYAGGIEWGSYERLVEKKIIDSRYDFYSDFRWGVSLVKLIYLRCSQTKSMTYDRDVQRLKNILEKAFSTNKGLIAYGD